MLLLKFDLDEIKNCKTAADAFRMMGIGVKEDDPQDLNIRNKEVFGDKAYYSNMIMSDSTFDAIYKQLRGESKLPTAEALAWTNYSPVSNGPRYDKVKEMAGGEINDSVLYIITPEDSIFEKAPNDNKEE